MSLDHDDTNRLLEEEHPGPDDLESALNEVPLTEIVKKDPLIVESNTSLATVLQAMQREDRGATLVVESGKLVGIFTERDVLLKVAGQPLDLAQAEIRAFMTRDPVTLPDDSTVALALNQMVLEGFRHIPLTDDEDRPVAEVSMRDLMEYLSEFFKLNLFSGLAGERPTTKE